jgi:aryl-alcohol dehydrogenase-like predicted oxidoreductase
VQQFHVWSDEWADRGDWLGAIQKLKKEGKIRFFGVSINDCHPAVSTVIPGMRSVRNVERNCQASDGRGLPKEQVERLKAHRWEHNFYG